MKPIFRRKEKIMKKTIQNKALSLLLALTLVTSCFTVFSFGAVAADSEAKTVEIISNNVYYGETLKLMYAVKAENLAESDSVIKIAPPIESRSYINLTVNALSAFGVICEWTDEYTISIKGNQKYTPTEVSVEGDYSGSAFTEALNLFGGEVEVLGLASDTLQGDSVYRRYYAMLDDGMPTIHIGDCPDLGPILFAVAAAKCGGVFSGTKRLKIKESDRASAMAQELQKFGAKVSVYEDSVVVYPADFHAPTEELSSHKDHRIVMALSILLTLTGGVIDGAEAVSKSYPEFFSDLKSLGIEVDEI